MSNRFHNIDWLAAVLYPLFVILMEAFWVYPWLFWIGHFPMFSPQRPPLSLASVIIMPAAAMLGVRYLLRPGWPNYVAQIVIVGGGFLVMLLVLAVEYRASYAFLSPGWFGYLGRSFGHFVGHPNTIAAAVPAMIYLWWRGTNLAQSTSYFKSIYNSFVLGLIALIILILVWQFSTTAGIFLLPGAGTGLEIIGFFFFGLLAIAVTHLYQMRGAMPKEEAGLSSVWRWLPIMLAVVGGMVVIVFVLTGAFSEGFFSGVAQGIYSIGHFFGKIVDILIIPLNYVFEALIWILRIIINLLRNQQQDQQPSNNSTQGELFPKTTPADIPPVFTAIIKWVVIILLIATVIFFLARAVSRYRARRALEDIEQLDESLLSWSGLNDDFRAFLAAMAKKMQRKRSQATGKVYSEEESARLEVREIYRRLLREAEVTGYPRGTFETPAEYAQRLGKAIQEGREPLDNLTDTYSGVRYGEVVPPEAKVVNANSLWNRLRGLLRGIRGE